MHDTNCDWLLAMRIIDNFTKNEELQIPHCLNNYNINYQNSRKRQNVYP